MASQVEHVAASGRHSACKDPLTESPPGAAARIDEGEAVRERRPCSAQPRNNLNLLALPAVRAANRLGHDTCQLCVAWAWRAPLRSRWVPETALVRSSTAYGPRATVGKVACFSWWN